MCTPFQTKFKGILLTLSLMLPLATGIAAAQEFRGTISGTVTDPTGAVVPGATVLIREVNTGTLNKTTADSAGQYVVPFLAPGNYSITVSFTGFESVQRGPITLQSQEHPIVDLSLKVGTTDQTVTVTSDAPLLDQANASIGQVISTESVADLPLNGRAPAVLAELSVGVITTAAPQIVHPFDNNAGNSWSMGGTPNQVSEVLLDGSPDLTLLGAQAYSPTQDSVQEVSIRPFDTDASFGHTIGGVINQITKTGTNAYHGTAYEFSQISNLDANTYFNDRNGVALAVTHFNQYGLTFGGPVRIPRLYNGKDKTFFFFAWENLKDSQPNTVTTTVPTAAEEAGDFSQTLAAGCPGGFANNPMTAAAICLPSGSNKTNYNDPNQLYNPFTATVSGSNVNRSPILDNQLTTAAPISPVAQAYFKLFPAPNATSGVSTAGQGNYITNAPSIDTYNNEFGRLDFNLGSSNHLFFDFRHNNRTQVKNNYFGNGSTGTNLLRENWGTTLDDVYILNPSTIFDVRVNWTYFDEVHGTPAQAYSPTDVGMPSSLVTSSELVQLPCVNFSASNSSTVGTCGGSSTYQGLGDNTSALDPTTSYQTFVDVVKLVGKHTLKVGFDGRRYQLRVASFGNAAGSFNFSPLFVTSGTTGATQTFGGDLADFFFGLPTAGQYDLAAKADYKSYYIGSFVQDDWRLNKHLTLNMGLRYDINTPFGEKFGRTVNGFNPTATNTASSAAAAFTPVTENNDNVSFTLNSINANGGLTFPNTNGGAPFTVTNGFFSPRLGFSYTPEWSHEKTVFRGGLGFFVQPETVASLNAAGSYSSTPLDNQEGFTASTQYVASTNADLTPAGNISNPFPSGLQQATGSSAGASTFLGQAISFMAPNEKNPYSERWNLGVQQSLTSSTLFEVMYVGNRGANLPVASQNLNAISAQYLTTSPYLNEALATDYGKTVTNPFKGLLPNSASCNGATVKLSYLLTPYPQFCNVAVTEQNQTIGKSWFNSFIAHIEQRQKHGLTLTANYSYSKTIEALTFLNDEDYSLSKRVSTLDHRHHFTAGATYLLPFGRGKAFSFGGSRWVDEVIGGFSVNGVYQFQSGPPIEFSADIPLQPNVTLQNIRSQPRNASAVGSGNPALNIADFVTGNSTTCPSPTTCDGNTFINGQYSNHLRTLPQTIDWVRGDGFNNLDASILKDFHFTESKFLQLRFETFNTFNHPIFAAPNVSSATASNFGYITATYASSLPRQVQLGARVVF